MKYDIQGELVLSAYARGTGPETSHQAAKSLSSDTLRRSQYAVLSVLCGALDGSATDEELVGEYSVRCVKPSWNIARQSDSGIRTRRKELVSQGLVENSGKKVRSVTGRMMIVWQVTDRGVSCWKGDA